MELLLIIGAAWIACGIFGYGLALGTCQYSFPFIAERYWKHDMMFSFMIGLLGLAGVVIMVLLSLSVKEASLYFMYRKPPASWYQERREARHRKILSGE